MHACGLLHDVGRFVQFEGAPADLGHVKDMHWTSPKELVDVERTTLGYDHALLGWHACKQWSLPESISEVVQHHHDVLPAETHAPVDMTRVVQWADELSTASVRYRTDAGRLDVQQCPDGSKMDAARTRRSRQVASSDAE